MVDNSNIRNKFQALLILLDHFLFFSTNLKKNFFFATKFILKNFKD